MPTPEITLAPADEKDIFLASPDILELVRNQITDTIESLAAAIEVCVTTDGTSLAFLEAIVNYTTQVQAIYEVAELASLVGLPEVCTFINGNLMALDTQEPTAKRVAQPYFEKWPAAVLDYLQTPLTGSQSLVQMMQDRAWPVPLEEEKAHQLLSLLTRSSTTSEPESLASKFEGGVEALAGEKEADEDSTSPADIGLEVTQEISLGSAAVLGMLTEELESAKEPLTKELQRFTTLNNQEAAFLEVAENYAGHIQFLHAVAEILGLPGLQNVCTFLVDNVKLLSQRELAARTKAKKVLEVWPDLIMAYLNSPMDSVIPLLNHLRKSQWAQPLADDKAHELLGLLMQGSTGERTIDEKPAYSRPTPAKPEEVSLKIPSEVNPELLDAYLQEMPQHASEFSDIIQQMIRSPQTSDIQRAQRIAHTLKAASSIVGIKGIANVAHHLEDILEYLAQHQVVPPKELTDTMMEAADCIELMVDALMGQEEAPPEALQVLQSVLDWANQIDKGNLQVPPAFSRPAPAATKVTPASDATAGTSEQVLSVPTKTIDNLIRSVDELSRSWRPIQESMKYVLQSNRGLTEQDLILQQQTFALENLVEVHGVTEIMPNRYNQISQDEESFDALEFKQYQELHSVAHSFMETMTNHRELVLSIRNDLAKLETMFIHQQQLNQECEASVMATRMVPVNTMLPRLQHLVKQTCRGTNKKAKLEVSGTDILIDYGVLNHLMDTLQQVLRDVIEHGIEVPEERVLLGKPESGHTHLSFYRKGNHVVVKCQDDGHWQRPFNTKATPVSNVAVDFQEEVLISVPTKTIDNLMQLVGELSISLGQIQERMKHVLQSTRMLTKHGGMLQQQTVALENLVDGRGVTGSSYSRVSHDENSFDTLELKEGHGLRSIAHRFMESIADYRKLARSIRNDLAELETMFIHQQRLNQEFEASVMAIRLVPVNTMLPQLQHLVRRTCKETNKKAELEVSGTDILIDREVLSDLGDLLKRLLRDVVIEHGIETPEERVLLGKPESGCIHLRFYREGKGITINKLSYYVGMYVRMIVILITRILTMKLTDSLKQLFIDTAAELTGAARRLFMAKVVKQLGSGGQSQAEQELGWNRGTLRKGLHELESGVTCLDNYSARGRKPCETSLPRLLEDLQAVVDGQSQTDPTFKSTRLYVRLSVREIRCQLIKQKGYLDQELPCDETLRQKLNQLGYHQRRVQKTRPQKKIPETNAIFEQWQIINQEADANPYTLRISIDAKATVKLGPFDRGGKTRVCTTACDHDFATQTVTPYGIFIPPTDEFFMYFVSSKLTSDCMVDILHEWWQTFRPRVPQIRTLVINQDNGPENNSSRTQFMKRLVEFAKINQLQVPLAYYPPYHSKYHPIERVWAVLEPHWNGSLLSDLDTAVQFARTMTWKGKHPLVKVVTQTYQTGVKLTKVAMAAIENQIERLTDLGKWFIKIAGPTEA